jgi:hypothetical protein
MICSLVGGTDLLFASAVTRPREASVEGRINEEHVSEYVPGVVVFTQHAINDFNGSYFCMSTKLRA